MRFILDTSTDAVYGAVLAPKASSALLWSSDLLMSLPRMRHFSHIGVSVPIRERRVFSHLFEKGGESSPYVPGVRCTWALYRTTRSIGKHRLIQWLVHSKVLCWDCLRQDKSKVFWSTSLKLYHVFTPFWGSHEPRQASCCLNSVSLTHFFSLPLKLR